MLYGIISYMHSHSCKWYFDCLPLKAFKLTDFPMLSRGSTNLELTTVMLAPVSIIILHGFCPIFPDTVYLVCGGGEMTRDILLGNCVFYGSFCCKQSKWEHMLDLEFLWLLFGNLISLMGTVMLHYICRS